MRNALVLLLLLSSPSVLADVSSDFEKGSGGLKAQWVDIFAQGLIFLAMFVLVMWVLHASLKQLINADTSDLYQIFSLVFRSFFICILVILTLT